MSEYKVTTAYKKIASLKKPIRIVQGGTSAGKTIAIMLYLTDLLQSSEKHASVVSESMPHMKKGALKEFLSIMKTHGYYDESLHNKSDSIYNFETGSMMEFFGVDSADKVHGPRRDILFINEANNIRFPVYDAMDIRTRDFTIIDYNPTTEFWVHTEIIPNFDHDFIILTYKDNEALEQKMIDKIESRRHNKNWWRVYGLGLVGTLEGLIHKHMEIVSEVPEGAQKVRYIVDFGFTNDPSAVGELYRYNGGFLVHELAHEEGLTNKRIANIIRAAEGLPLVDKHHDYREETEILTVADSAEPKSVKDLNDYGVKAVGATKGQGSVKAGIDIVNEYPLYVTEESTGFLKDLRNYAWKVDKLTNKPMNVPEHEFSHSPDAIRYGITDVIGIHEISVDDIAM